MQLGLGTGTFDTTIRFEGDRDVDVEMSSVSVSGAWLINEQWSVRAAGGILTSGELVTGNGMTHDVDSGGLAAVGGEYRADIHHYQIALGASYQVGPVGIYAEWAGLGEKALSAGLSAVW